MGLLLSIYKFGRFQRALYFGRDLFFWTTETDGPRVETRSFIVLRGLVQGPATPVSLENMSPYHRFQSRRREHSHSGPTTAVSPRSNNLRRGRAMLRVVLACVVMTLTTLQVHLQWWHQHNDDDVTSERHPLIKGRRGLRFRLRTPATADQVRFMALGSSSTWGEGLQRITQQAYPYLLSPYVHNVAFRGPHGLAMSAACTQSMVGDEAIYDVITIEWTIFDQSLVVLATRLRQRFPSAMIIFVHLWNPSHLRYHLPSLTTEDRDYSALDFWQWSSQQNISFALHSVELSIAMHDAGADRWSIQKSDAGAIQKLVQNVQGHQVVLPYPEPKSFFFPQTLRQYFAYFLEDRPQVLSPLGHLYIAERVRAMVNARHVLKRSGRDKTGSWGSGDQCHFWDPASTLDLNAWINYVNLSSISSKSSPDEPSHVMEIGVDHPSSFSVKNPFTEDRMLYLTYMTAEDEEVFPRTLVRISGKRSVQINPYHDMLMGDVNNINNLSEQTLVARTSAVGVVPPGVSVVQLEALQRTLRAFHLVGASFIYEEMSGAPIEFALEPNPSPPSDVLGGFGLTQ